VALAIGEHLENPPWFTEDWDTGVIQGELVPGAMHVKISGGPKWDRKVAKGTVGEKQQFTGKGAKNLTIRFRVWTESQHNEFKARILPLLDPPAAKEAPKACTLEHPVAEARQVRAFQVDEDGLEGPTLNDEATYAEYTCKAFEYVEPAPAPKGGGKPGQTPCQQARADYEAWCHEWAQQNELVATLITQGMPQADVDAANAQAINAQNKMIEAAQRLESLNCSAEQSPSSEAAAGSPPPP
jgi:hypothetical protein